MSLPITTHAIYKFEKKHAKSTYTLLKNAHAVFKSNIMLLRKFEDPSSNTRVNIKIFKIYTVSSWNHHLVSLGDLPFLHFFT